MVLNRWTILAVILLLSTLVGLLYWPLFPRVNLQLTPLFYTALGLTTLQAVVVIVGPIAAIFRLVRPERKADAPPVLASITAPIAIFLANLPKLRDARGGQEYTTAEYVLAGYQAVKILWWTYFIHLALGPILLIINVIVLTGQRNDWMFPPVFGLVLFAPLFAIFAIILNVVYSCTYSRIVGGLQLRTMGRTDAGGRSWIRVRHTPFVGVFVTGFVILPILWGFYRGLIAEL